jgi:hypothetical protein
VQAFVGGQGGVVCGTASPGGALDAVAIDSTAVGGASGVAIAPDGAGGYWEAHGRTAGLWLEHLDGAGAVISSEQLSTRWTVFTSVAIDARGGQHLAIQHYDSSNGTYELTYTERLGGEAWSPEVELDVSGSLSWRSLAMDAGGRAHLSWLSFTGYHPHYDERPPGGSWSDQTIVEPKGYEQVEPQTVAMPDGSARVAYVVGDLGARTDDLHLGVSSTGTLAIQEVTPIIP